MYEVKCLCSNASLVSSETVRFFLVASTIELNDALQLIREEPLPQLLTFPSIISTYLVL